MSSEQIIWILVAIVVVAALIGVAMMASKRRSTAQEEHRRHEAEQLREDAVAGASGLTSSRAEAQEARAEAEAARNRAAQAEQGVAMDEAVVEDRVREADRVDPDIDHRSDEYEPETPAVRGDAATSDGLGQRDQAVDETTHPATHPTTHPTTAETDETSDPAAPVAERHPPADPDDASGTHRA